MVNRKWAYRELFNSEEAAGVRLPFQIGILSCTMHRCMIHDVQVVARQPQSTVPSP
jgi:hypothetical protein